jgi:DNA invertase Pin-like site-specific DNA recombinase
MGSAQSIKEQSRLFFARAAAEGWEVGGWFEDKVSASSYGRKKGIVRDAWPEVRANLTEILWLNESSRGDRELSQWAAFLEQCRDGGARVWVEQHERLFDLRIAGDWRTLATDGVDSEMEARRISRRVRTGMDRNVREGRTHGRIPFGYTRRYEYERDEDGKRQRVVIQELHPVQSLVVKEIYARIRAGESLKSIARDLNARRIFLNTGTEWTESRVRSLALRPLYMGKRIHNETPSKFIIPEQTVLTDAQWPAIVDETLFWIVYNKLTDPSRLNHKPGGAKHLLSLIARCGECNGPLTARNDGGWKYICRDKHCVMIREAELDVYVMFEIIRFLSNEKNYQQPSENGQVQGMYAQIGEKQAARERLGEAVAHGMDPVIAGKTDKRLALEIRELEEKIREVTIPSVLMDFAERSDDVAQRLEDTTLAGKREIVRAVMERKGYVRLHRSPPGRQPGSVPAVDRVSWAA